MTVKLLLIDSDRLFREKMNAHCPQDRYSLTTAPDALSAVEAFYEHTPDFLMVNTRLPDAPGFDVVNRLKQHRKFPFIMLTDEHDLETELAAFDYGCEDFISKPVDMSVLYARVHAASERHNLGDKHIATLTCGPITMNTQRRTTVVSGNDVALTRIEFDLLALMVESPQRVFQRDELLSLVWGSWYGDSHTIESHMSRLRRKIMDAGGPSIGHAVRGIGYCLGLNEFA